MPHPTFPLLFALALAASAPAQIIPVSGGGAALANAVALAPSGAILVVSPGTYNGFAFQLNKDVTIVAPQRATISGDLTSSGPGTQWTLQLSGLDIFGVPQYPFPPSGGLLSTNGHLRAEDCRTWNLSVSGAAATRRVYARGCSFAGVNASNSLIGVDAVLVDCSFASSANNNGQATWTALTVTGSLRAERITVAPTNYTFVAAPGLDLTGTATIANSTLSGAISPMGQGWAIMNRVPGALTLWSCTTAGGVANPYVTRPLATASWSQRNFMAGGTSIVTYQEAANTAMAVVVALDTVPWSPAFAAEPLYFGATPNWFVHQLATTDAQGTFAGAFAIPNTPVLQYVNANLIGAFFDPLPMRTTCPLGGVIL